MMMELSNAQKKLIHSLDRTKARRETSLFKAEGTKCVLDTIESFATEYLVATSSWLEQHGDRVRGVDNIYKAAPSDMGRISSLTTPPEVVAVYRIPTPELNIERLYGQLSIALDNVQDPGNLGTIMRTADWFGIRDILCSYGCADCYNPKVVQATMGAISRVNVHYCDLAQTLGSLNGSVPVYGTFLDGANIFRAKLPESAVIVMGNEGRGVSDEVAEKISHRLLIPSYPAGEVTSESLNVATATAITVAEFRRGLL